MPPAKGPKNPATVMTVRMKRRLHGEKAEYGGGGPSIGPFSGSGCPDGVGAGSIGCLTALVSFCSGLLFSDDLSNGGSREKYIREGASAIDTKGVRSESAMAV